MKRTSFLCHMVPPVPTAQKRNLLSDPAFHQEDLFAPATLDAARHATRMCPYLEDHSLDLPHRLGRLGGGTSLRLRHPGDALNLRLLLLRRKALKPSSWTRFTPQKKSPDPPRGFFGDRSLSSLCGPVGFRGVAPHHSLSTLNSFISDFTWIASPWEESTISSGCCASG